MISFVDTTLRCPSAGDHCALDQGREGGGGRTLTFNGHTEGNLAGYAQGGKGQRSLLWLATMNGADANVLAAYSDRS